MARDTPLRQEFESYREAELASRRPHADPERRPGAATGGQVSGGAVEYVPYGLSADPAAAACRLMATLGPVEAEYAALRRGAGVVDCPQRGTLRVGGADRVDFLDRIVTAALKSLAPGEARQAFLIARTGRIEADLVVVALEDHVLIDVDVLQVAATAAGLARYLFAEDVAIEDLSADRHRLAVHGRLAVPVVAAAAGEAGWSPEPGRAAPLAIDGIDVVAWRLDEVGEAGVHLAVPAAGAARVWRALLGADGPVGDGRRRVRPAGWYAWNTARIEAGTPLMNVDFGTGNLPHETGVLDSRVSFTKGCYPGQEIVARMQNLGRPKQIVRLLRSKADRLPVAGAAIASPRDDAPVGVVTSSTLSPLLGAAPIALGMIRTPHHEPGTILLVEAEGEPTEAEVVASFRP